MTLQHQDRILVEKDGEEIEVFNHVSVSRYYYVNAINGYEEFQPHVAQGDMGQGPPPEAVTKRVADLLWAEFGIEVEAYDIEVVDVESDEVIVL